MSARYTLVCNGCGIDSPKRSERSLQNARAFSFGIGWTHPKPGLDFCSECSAARARAEKERNPHGYA